MTRYAKLLIPALLAACSASGGGPSDPGAPVPSGQSVTLRVGESASIGAVTVRFQGVPEDSRCALDVTCVWAGNGRVDLHLSTPSDTRVVSLNTLLDPRAVEFAGLRLGLAALDPYPAHAGQPVDPSSYVATLEILDD